MLAGGVSIVHFHGVALCVFVSLSFCVLCVCAALCNCVKPRKGKLGFYQHCHLISFSSQFQQKSATLKSEENSDGYSILACNSSFLRCFFPTQIFPARKVSVKRR